MKIKNMKRKRLLRKYNIQEENLDRVIEKLKQKVSAQMQRFSRHWKRQNKYYKNKMFRTDCKKFYHLLRQKNIKVTNAPTKEETDNFWKEIFGK